MPWARHSLHSQALSIPSSSACCFSYSQLASETVVVCGDNGLHERPARRALLSLLLPPRPTRRRRLRRVAERARHVLWRRRRVRHNGRRLRVRQPVQQRVRHEHGGAEHGAVQRRSGVRVLLRAALRQRRAVVPAGQHHRDGHQLLPAQLRTPQRRRRLVQPAAPALRHGSAGVPPDRAVPRGHRARPIQEGALREEGRHPVHHQRPLLLQPGAGDQRGRRRRRAVRLHQGLQHRVADHVPQLGPELAEQLAPRRPEPLLPGHLQRRPHRHQQQRRAGRMAVWPDLRRRPVLAGLLARSIHSFSFTAERIMSVDPQAFGFGVFARD